MSLQNLLGRFNSATTLKLSGVYKSYFNSFLIKWFNAIFPELIPRFESERNCIFYTFIAVPIIYFIMEVWRRWLLRASLKNLRPVVQLPVPPQYKLQSK